MSINVKEISDMIPVQIYLSPVQYARLKEHSERAQKSMSALIRDAVDAYLRQEETPSIFPADDPLFNLIGMIDTEPEDASVTHDHHLYRDPHK